MKFDKDGNLDLAACSLKELRDFFSGEILQAFVSEGGKGLRTELWVAMVTTMQWRRLHDGDLVAKAEERAVAAEGELKSYKEGWNSALDEAHADNKRLKDLLVEASRAMQSVLVAIPHGPYGGPEPADIHWPRASATATREFGLVLYKIAQAVEDPTKDWNKDA